MDELLQAYAQQQLKTIVADETYYCPTFQRWMTKGETHQVTRDECCLDACNVCDSTITDYTRPF